MIYFLRAGTDGHVKIGWSRDDASLKRRIATLQTGQPLPLAVIRTIEAERWVEGWLHGFYAGVRAAGKWFAFQPDMLFVRHPDAKPKRHSKPTPKTAIVHLPAGDLSETLHQWRATLRLTQPVAAAALGVPLRTYQGWEGGREPEHPTLLRLALTAVRELIEREGAA